MATINSITAATALGSADKVLIETPLGPKSIRGSVLKEQVTADSLKKGTIIWEDDSGATTGSLTTDLEIGNIYDIFVRSTDTSPECATQILKFKKREVPVSGNPSGDSEALSGVFTFAGAAAAFTVKLFYDNFTTTNCKVYKIINYGADE